MVAFSSSPARRPRLQKSDTLSYLPLSMHHLRTHSLISVIDAIAYFSVNRRDRDYEMCLSLGEKKFTAVEDGDVWCANDNDATAAFWLRGI